MPKSQTDAIMTYSNVNSAGFSIFFIFSNSLSIFFFMYQKDSQDDEFFLPIPVSCFLFHDKLFGTLIAHCILFNALKIIKKMKKILLILLLFSTLSGMFGQSLRLVRTDTDSLHSGFITSTYLFSVDIYIDSIKNCYGAAIELHYTPFQYVNLSAAYFSDIWDKSTSTIITNIDSLSNKGTIVIGVLSNNLLNIDKAGSIKVGTMEFVVNQLAPNNQSFIFNFSTAQGIFIDSSKQKYVDLKPPNVSYLIHGFTNTWPGDANNDGKVDVNDITRIGVYLNFAAKHSDYRTFKRQSASTHWSAQRVLSWDSLQVTYADCDGDGEVNINDLLIVPLNFSKTKSGMFDNKNDKPLTNNFAESADSLNIDFDLLPIRINTNEKLIAIAGVIDLNGLLARCKTFSFMCPDKSAGNYEYSIISDDNNMIFTTGNFNNEIIGTKDGIIGYLKVEKSNDPYKSKSPEFNFNELSGLTADGRIIPLNKLMDINDKSIQSQELIIIDDNIIINESSTNYNPVLIKIYNILGNLIWQIQSENSTINIPINNLSSGFYIIKIDADNIIKNFTFIKK